jgi:hypothetical protein
MRPTAVIAALILLVSACSDGSTAEPSTVTPISALDTSTPSADCPLKSAPPTPSASFVVRLPDGREAANPGDNTIVVLAAAGETIVLAVEVVVAEEVTLESLSFSASPGGERATPKRLATAEGETAGTLRIDVPWTAPAGGEYRLRAKAEVGADDRDPCANLTGATEGWGLATLRVGDS